MDMNDFANIKSKNYDVEENEQNKKDPYEQNNDDNQSSETNDLKLFKTTDFINDLQSRSHEKNKERLNKGKNINAYDISVECIRKVLFKLLNYPVKDYSDNWLPISMRGTIGNAVHDFIQESNLFTETELILKVPSLRISGRLDGMINNNVMVGIKSVAYKDYETILKKQLPRKTDFIQEIIYTYLIENHLEEIKKQKPYFNFKLPSLDKYNIEYLQFIYVCHELIASDDQGMTNDINFSKSLKKKLSSRSNPFWFITTLTIDLKGVDTQKYIDYILEKVQEINTHFDQNKIPELNNKFVDTKQCYFCIFNKICSKY